ncbi:thiosulfate:glutathione sulfurtransferase isoform X2 [Gouania willdenowi]|nr:thiosulfate:glutathione sulfurtransferase-like isoform X2 [Gouania willdenowi]
MISSLLSYSLCAAVTAVTQGSHCAAHSSLRAFITSTAQRGPQCGHSADSVSVVTHLQLKNMLSTGDIQLFDVRNPEEYEAGHILKAINIPLSNLEESLKLSPEHFEQKFRVKAPEKDDTNIVFQCRSGRRSATALEIANQLGFTRARHYKGGYIEWVEREEK